MSAYVYAEKIVYMGVFKNLIYFGKIIFFDPVKNRKSNASISKFIDNDKAATLVCATTTMNSFFNKKKQNGLPLIIYSGQDRNGTERSGKKLCEHAYFACLHVLTETCLSVHGKS